MDSNLRILHIRDARSAELDEASLLIRDAYQEYENSLPSWSWKLYVQDIMDVRSRLVVAQLIVAELSGRLVGAVTLYPDASRSPYEGWPGGWAGIRLLAVHPAYRGRGIGRALMEDCVRRCREKGIATIGLHTTEVMEAARRLYERMGFRRVPEFDLRPPHGTLVIAYRLDL